MRPRRLTPDFRERIWGTTKLSPWYPDSDQKIGEVWFDADLPLLAKFIFTSEKLSVQVHPDDAYARTHHGSRGKTEMWHILAAEPGAKIAAGLRESLNGEQLREAAQSGAIEQILEWHDARAGDTFFIPAGTIHAIGAGLTLCEIQQNSDVTYRLYDYGRPRELHLDRAAQVSRPAPHAARCEADGETLVSCDHFVVRRLAVHHSAEIEVSDSGFLIVIAGNGELDQNPSQAGDVWTFTPDAGRIRLAGNLTVLQATTT
jgi:mannose-6-phosphate isomerase